MLEARMSKAEMQYKLTLRLIYARGQLATLFHTTIWNFNTDIMFLKHEYNWAGPVWHFGNFKSLRGLQVLDTSNILRGFFARLSVHSVIHFSFLVG